MTDIAPPRHTLRTPGFLLGFALGGFLDGILFHQVLQWHHLLSNVDAAGVQDPRVQIMADGLFHVLMYLLAAAGLALLWRRRVDFGAPAGGQATWVWLVAGFGAWQLVDVVVFHWVLRIHHVRMDSPHPVLWDAGLAAVGAAIVLLAWRLARKPPRGGGRGSRGAAVSLTLAVVAAGGAALWPPADGEEVMVLFAPGTHPAAALGAIGQVDARVTWVDGSGSLWAVRLARPGDARALYARGAWLVGNAPVGLGCFSWARPDRVALR
jgi:uncharacterized membrane protein